MQIKYQLWWNLFDLAHNMLSDCCDIYIHVYTCLLILGVVCNMQNGTTRNTDLIRTMTHT